MSQAAAMLDNAETDKELGSHDLMEQAVRPFGGLSANTSVCVWSSCPSQPVCEVALGAQNLVSPSSLWGLLLSTEKSRRAVWGRTGAHWQGTLLLVLMSGQ